MAHTAEQTASMKERDEWFASRPPEEQAALRAGALSWPDRKMQRYGKFFWRLDGPFDWTDCDQVEVIVGRLSGVPTLKDSRFSADSLLSIHEDGMSAEEIVEEYELDLWQVKAVLDFANSRKQISLAA